MTSPILYAFRPMVRDLPEGTTNDWLAWFCRFSSGHLAHMNALDNQHCAKNNIPVQVLDCWWSEYLAWLDEAHWYEDSATTAAAAVEGFKPMGTVVEVDG